MGMDFVYSCAFIYFFVLFIFCLYLSVTINFFSTYYIINIK